MSVQVRRRREAASFLASFVGAQGELLVDTTNNRVQVHDGTTPGGWPAAKLADVIARTAVADATYTALMTDRTIAYTALTAARTVNLPAASAYPTGTQLLVVDETGACSVTKTLTVNAAGTDLINGAGVAVIALAYGFLAIESNGAGKWTIVDQSTASMAQQTASAVAITGGTINGTSLGVTTAGTAKVTTLNASSAVALASTLGVTGLATFADADINAGTIDATAIGSSTPSTGVFTTVGFPNATGTAGTANKITLYSTSYGFGISGGSLDSISGANHTFYSGSSIVGLLTTTGLNATAIGASTASTVKGTTITATTSVVPATDNAVPLGASSFRFSQLYAGTSTINTSDAREKTSVTALSDAEAAAAKALAAAVGSYKFLAAVAAKGDAARIHIGMTVQNAMSIMTAHGLDPMAYGFICHDAWDTVAAVAAVPATPDVPAVYAPVLDADGHPTGEQKVMTPEIFGTPEIPAIPGRPAGDRYGFRVEELLLFLARGFDARLAVLEAK